ncbi:conserved hypothetical protein [uncultured Dysgonomonas sp.]|uniref:Uncharacterized protein n=1 Tax=uncultured Dysgonomonas sp. TaxID=206096 RepID=A0A212IV73_9BACT|nr:three component ABC system middle component [uncultured Dysgonomonas sp.]SBV91097.1 conserved hypothetical protein [uncultured Dysgonomonas sp.]
MKNWEERSVITANLLNPAFCGEVIRRTIASYNNNEDNEVFPFSLLFLILPIVLHKKTREHMPMRSSTYFHSWVEENEFLFIDFAERVRELNPFSKESMSFMLQHGAAEITEDGKITIRPYRKKTPRGENIDEIIEIYRKAELLGKWFRLTGNEQTIYMFLKIRP